MLLCLLALLLAPAADASAPRTVSSVRLVLPPGVDSGRYSSYVGVKAGDPFDPLAVSKTVELLFATGRFKDIVVERELSGEAYDLVIRAIPAPLLLAVRVEGDRPMSPNAIAGVAHLRRGEPLFPKRLDQVAQATALALEAEGYLEARVTAEALERIGGADAVFRVHAGPKVRVGEVSLLGAGANLREKLPGQGRVFRRGEVRKAAQKIKAELVKRGFWQAQVAVKETYHPMTALMDLEVSVESGRTMAVDFRGRKLSRKVRNSLVSLLRDGGLAADAVEEAKERIEEGLRAEGYRDAFVSYREETRSDGATLVYVTEPGPEAEVASVRFLGFSAEGLPGEVETRALRPLVDRVVDEDVGRLRAFLQREGYAAAEVESDVPEGGGTLAVTFRLRPGPRTFLKTFKIEAPQEVKLGLTQARSRVGGPFRARDVALDRAALLKVYQAAGYLQAEVQVETTFTDDGSEASVILKVNPGQRIEVAQIVIAGLRVTHPEVVTRELLVKAGGPLGSEALVDSQRRLSALGIFDRVSITEIDPEAPFRRSLVVTADEAPRTAFAYGLGYAEQDLLRGSFEVTEKNVLGMDRSVTAFVRASVKGNDRLEATLREPYLLGHKLDLFLTGFDEREYLVGYAYRRDGGQLQTALRVGARSGLILRFGYQKTDLFDVTIPLSQIDRQFQTSIFAGPSASFIEDTRDDPIDPKRGAFVSTDVQLSSSVFGGDSFWKGFVQGSTYHALLPGLVLAASARMGLAWTLVSGGPVLLPLADRFFAGGDNSLRGFALDAVGPTEVTANGTPVPSGGNALVLGSIELRIDVGHNVSLAVFSDTGNVFPLVDEFTLSDLRYAAGLGLRYKTAIGPLRLDYGYKLNRLPGESPGHLHVTIGYAF